MSVMPEECFAPDMMSEMTTPPPAKRFCNPLPELKKRRRELEAEAYKNIIEFRWENKDSGSDNDSGSGHSRGNDTRELEQRIHYLQLDLANAKQEILEFRDVKLLLDEYCKLHIPHYNDNITGYKKLIGLLEHTPYKEVEKRESECISMVNLPMENDAYAPDFMAKYAPVSEALTHYKRMLKKEETSLSETFWRIIEEKKKAEVNDILKKVSLFILTCTVFIIITFIILLCVSGLIRIS